MPTPDFVTFTGIDARTDLDRVRALSRAYPIEWGILFSPKKQGLAPRYPEQGLIHVAVSELQDDPAIKLAAHLCGMHSAKIMSGMEPGIDLSGFNRTQINTVKPDVDKIEAFAQRHSILAITQHRTLRFPDDDRILWLYDCSGGRGDLPDKGWPLHPEEDRIVGYAGGLNPENVARINDEIAPTGRYWLDMESGIRTDDWLDLDKCEAVCRALF